MCRLVFNYCSLIFLYILHFFSCVHFSIGNQDTNHTSMDIGSFLKDLDDEVNQQIEKDNFCAKANIADLKPIPGVNVIDVSFKLTDKRFQNCSYELFKIILEKKRKVIKEVKVPYSHKRQEEISYRFENISCGIYNIIVQPCYNDRSCAFISWLPEKSINVTNNNCINILQNKYTSNENHSSFRIALIIVCVLMPLTFGILFYIHKRDCQKQKYMLIDNNCSVAEYCAEIVLCGDLGQERKSMVIYIFYKYDKKGIMKNKVNNFQTVVLESKLPSIFYAVIRKDMDSFLDIHMKTIDFELRETACLDNVNSWLENALKKTGKDGILQRCMLVESSKEMDEEDIIENEIFSYVQGKVRNSDKDYDNLFIVQSDDLPEDLSGYSEKLNEQSIQTIISRDSHHFHWLNFCFDICSEFVSPKTRKNFVNPFQEYVDKKSSAVKSFLNFSERESIC